MSTKRKPRRLSPIAALKQLDRIERKGGSFHIDGARIIRRALGNSK